MTGQYQDCRLEVEPSGPVIVGECEVGNGYFFIVCPPIMDHSVDDADQTQKGPECPLFPLPQGCKLIPTTTFYSPVPLHSGSSLCTNRDDNGHLKGNILERHHAPTTSPKSMTTKTVIATGASASSTGVLAVRDSTLIMDRSVDVDDVHHKIPECPVLLAQGCQTHPYDN